MKLTTLALQNEDVLRALDGHVSGQSSSKTWTSIADLAAHLGRDDSNLGKSLRALHTGGLIYQPASWNGLTDNGRAMLAALKRAAGDNPPLRTGEGDRAAVEGASGALEGYINLPHAYIAPDPLNPRKHFDDDALNELATSILRDGLLENLVVRPKAKGETKHRLVAGERRWRAIGKLIERGQWGGGSAIMCKVVDLDDAGHRRIALVENLQRKDLRPIDEAMALKELMAIEDMGTAEVALEIGFTQRFVQQRLQLLDLPDALRDKINTGDLTIERGREAAAIFDKLPPMKQVELIKGKITVDDAKKWHASQPKPLELDPKVWLMIAEIYDRVKSDPLPTDRYENGATEVHADARFEERLTGLNTWPAYVMGNVSHILDGFGDATGRFKISLGHSTCEQLSRRFGKEFNVDDDNQRLFLIQQLRRETFAGALGSGYYTTSWLNGPFEVSAGLQAEIEEKRQEAATRRAARAEEDAQRAAEQAEANRRTGETFNLAQSILAQTRKADLAAIDRRFADTFGRLEIFLPVCLDDGANVIDAKGKELVRSGWGLNNAPTHVRARNMLLAIAINAAAGLPTPDEPPARLDEDAMDEGDFLLAVATRLLEGDDDITPDEAAEKARRGLDAYLAEEEIVYAQEGYDWEDDTAANMAVWIREDGLGAQVDLEDAIAAAPDAADAPEDDTPITPALERLAGVPGQPETVAP